MKFTNNVNTIPSVLRLSALTAASLDDDCKYLITCDAPRSDFVKYPAINSDIFSTTMPIANNVQTSINNNG